MPMLKCMQGLERACAKQSKLFWEVSPHKNIIYRNQNKILQWSECL
jgi:hypothetical protein